MLAPQLKLQQKQKLKLTQSLRQSIEIMQLDKDEIEELIQKEKEENPLLSLDENHGEIINDEPSEAPLAEVTEVLSTPLAEENLDRDEDYNNEYDQDKSIRPYYGTQALHDAGSVIEATYAENANFYEDIKQQIRLSLAQKQDRAIALFWLSQLDEAGRLPTKAFQKALQFYDDEADLEFLLARLQQLEPVGLFARNLKECLKAQLIDQEKWDDIWLHLFEYLEQISIQNLDFIAKKINISPVELAKRLKYLKTLNPRPAWQGDINVEKTATIIPELIVGQHPSGEWFIELNPEAFNPMILGEMDVMKKRDKKEQNWLQIRHQKGRMLMQMLARRAESILTIGQIILQKQVLFFEKGENYLRPLTMSSLTSELDMHESTISRLVRHKYLYVAGQSIELRWFFQSGRIASDYGADVSAKSVQMRIGELIENEPKIKPYSDEKLAMILKQNYGYHIARRTVVKYREAMNIPSSFMRKQKYKNHL